MARRRVVRCLLRAFISCRTRTRLVMRSRGEVFLSGYEARFLFRHKRIQGREVMGFALV